MINNQEELIKELNSLFGTGWWIEEELKILAYFIIEDRKRVVEPLIRLRWDEGKLLDTISNIDKGIDETLKNAGIETDK